LLKRAAARTHSESVTLTEADQIIAKLELLPHPEGGHYRETFRDIVENSGRSASTAILYLLKQGEVSHWHRIDAVEIWHWYAGAPLELMLSADGRDSHTLHAWKSVGQWTQAPGDRSTNMVAICARPRRVRLGRLHRGSRLRVQRV
jgi:predicted cupin superfamily sugar epimerase